MTQTDPTDPQAWLLRARSNLLLAQKGQRKGVVLEDLALMHSKRQRKPSRPFV